MATVSNEQIDGVFQRHWNKNPLRYALATTALTVLPGVISGAAALSFSHRPLSTIFTMAACSAAVGVLAKISHAAGEDHERSKKLPSAAESYQTIARHIFQRAGLQFSPDVRISRDHVAAIACVPDDGDVIYMMVDPEQLKPWQRKQVGAAFSHEAAHVINRPPTFSLTTFLSKWLYWGFAVSLPWPGIMAMVVCRPLMHIPFVLARRLDEDRADRNSIGIYPEPEALKFLFSRAIKARNEDKEKQAAWHKAFPEIEKIEREGCFGFLCRTFEIFVKPWLDPHTATEKRKELVDRYYAEAEKIYRAHAIDPEEACAALLRRVDAPAPG